MSTQQPTRPPSRSTIRRVVTAAFVGNTVEWFDYAAYGYLATTLALVFFPAAAPGTALLSTFGVFALSFIVRPVGGVLWGRFGDRLGRRAALSLSIGIMSVATFLIGCLPGHATIGIAAPLLLLLVRLVQGLSAAGEYPGAATFLYEYAAEGRRGRYVCMVPASTAAGLLLGSTTVWILTSTLTDEQMLTWGWRIPFLVAGPLGLIGRYIRARLEDTPEFRNQPAGHRSPMPLGTLLTAYRAQILLAFGVTCLNAIGFYMLLTYLPTYLVETVGVGEGQAMASTTISLICYIGTVIVVGRISDRVGRPRMLLTAAILFTVLAVPAFALLGSHGIVLAAAVQVLLGIMLTINDGTLPTYLAELFPTEVRYSGFGISFNTANALFGGTAPLIATALVQGTGNDVSPAWYLAAAGLTAAVTLLLGRRVPMRAAEPAGRGRLIGSG